MRRPVDSLRVLDFGTVSALRSQTSWHAVALALAATDGPTLSFARPGSPYVCLGFHRDLAEVDVAYCAEQGLPIFRRMVGGGPVYLDAGQLLFQIALPAHQVPPRRDVALAELLEPAAEALRTLGVPAHVDEWGELSVEDRKVCGHGAAQLQDCVVVVGNLITAFDHGRAARVLDVGSEQVRGEVTRLMRRYVAATPVDPGAWQAALVDAYCRHFRTWPLAGRFTAAERRRLAELDRQFTDPAWVDGERRPARTVRTVKVRSGVWVHSVEQAGTRTVLSVADGRIANVLVEPAAGRDAGVIVEPADGRDAAGYDGLIGARLDVACRELAALPHAGPLATVLQAAQPEGVPA